MRRYAVELTRFVAAVAVLTTALTTWGAAVATAQQAPVLDEAAIRLAVERALTRAPRGFEALQPPAQTGVRVLSVDVQQTASGQRLVIDLSQRALTYDPRGGVEALTDHVIAATAPLTAGARNLDYRILIDGLPLDQFVPRVVAPRVSANQVTMTGPLVISAGHGWYYDEWFAAWRLQRDYYWGIVEDFVNHDIVYYLDGELKAAGLQTRTVRNPDRAAGTGTSGRARWEESAKYHIREIGAPPEIWDYGADDYSKDINSRPFYANWIDSVAVVSIHNNGGGATGTETWYDASNGFEAESQRLAEIVNRKVVSAIRERYDPAWPDRGLRSCNGCKGETRLAASPAIIVEIAYMDTKTPDNDALHSEAFKRIVAQAIREAVQEWGLRPAPVDSGESSSQDISRLKPF